MLALVLGWVLPYQSTPSLLHKQPKGRFGLHAIVGKKEEDDVGEILMEILQISLPHIYM